MHRRRQWDPSPVLLPGKSHGRRSLVGCSPWDRTESDTTERLSSSSSSTTCIHLELSLSLLPWFLELHLRSIPLGSLVPAKTLRQVQTSYSVRNTWEHLHACLYGPPGPRPSMNFAPLPPPTSSCFTLPQIVLLQPARPSCSREVKLVLPQDIYTCNPFFF